MSIRSNQDCGVPRRVQLRRTLAMRFYKQSAEHDIKQNSNTNIFGVYN